MKSSWFRVDRKYFRSDKRTEPFMDYLEVQKNLHIMRLLLIYHRSGI